MSRCPPAEAPASHRAGSARWTSWPSERGFGAVVGEFAGGDQGLGYVIVASGASADTPLAFAAMTLLSVISVLLFYVMVVLEHLLLPWAREITG